MDHPKVLTWEIFCTHIGLNRNSRWKTVKKDLQEFVLHPIEWWKCKLSLVKIETKGFGSCNSVEVKRNLPNIINLQSNCSSSWHQLSAERSLLCWDKILFDTRWVSFRRGFLQVFILGSFLYSLAVVSVSAKWVSGSGNTSNCLSKQTTQNYSLYIERKKFSKVQLILFVTAVLFCWFKLNLQVIYPLYRHSRIHFFIKIKEGMYIY